MGMETARTDQYASFQLFFKKATGNEPFPYQERLATSQRLPQILNAPTGAGKTAAVVLSWLWRRRFAEESVRDSTPRRLVYCLPMRVLVEQTRDEAKKWLGNLNLLAEKQRDGENEVAVTVLMGGEDVDEWDSFPERDAIIIGTQDMLLSRALNRGYAMSRFRWPVHYALLNNDCLWVLDELQLMGVGVETSAQLQGLRSEGKQLGCIGNTMTLWMSATVDKDRLATFDHSVPGESEIHGVGNDDASQAVLKERIDARKPVKKLDASIGDNDYYAKLAKSIVDGHREGTLSLAIVNTVKGARKVYCAVEKEIEAAKKAIPCALIHSRFRSGDREKNTALLLKEKDSEEKNRIVVATQVVEAGVDVSAARLITEIASWPSLVQRFGRCNRYGKCNAVAEILWIDAPIAKNGEGKKGKTNFNAPYDPAEIASARNLLAGLEDGGIKSLEIAGKDYRPSPAEYQVIRRRDIVDLFDTTPDLTGNDLDVSRYIRESDDTDVQVFWRKNVGGTEFDYESNPPRREELCSVPIGDVKNLLGKSEDGEAEGANAPKRRKKQAVSFWRWNPRDKQLDEIKDASLVVPGQVLLLDCKAGGYDEKTGWDADLVGRGEVDESERSDKQPKGEEDSYDSDRLTYVGGKNVLLDRHTNDVETEVDLLTAELELEPDKVNALKTAARWHDVGKSHAVFRKMIGNLNPSLDAHQFWAKTENPDRKRTRYERKHFRHELASALAWLQEGTDGNLDANLIAYLIASHHGKVRLLLRSLPGEGKPNNPSDGRPYARGVWDGDKLPPVPLLLPGGATLDLSLMALGEGSWLERTLSLRDDPAIGPFRLAYYEALLRIADWRASRKEGMG